MIVSRRRDSALTDVVLKGLLHDGAAGVWHARHPHHHAHPRAGSGLAPGQGRWILQSNSCEIVLGIT